MFLAISPLAGSMLVVIHNSLCDTLLPGRSSPAITTQQQFRIEAEPEVVFDLLADPTKTSVWLPKVQEVTMSPDEPLRKGLSGHFTYGLGPKRMEFGFTRHEFDRPRFISVGMTQGNTTTRSSYELTPVENGTGIRYRFQA